MVTHGILCPPNAEEWAWLTGAAASVSLHDADGSARRIEPQQSAHVRSGRLQPDRRRGEVGSGQGRLYPALQQGTSRSVPSLTTRYVKVVCTQPDNKVRQGRVYLALQQGTSRSCVPSLTTRYVKVVCTQPDNKVRQGRVYPALQQGRSKSCVPSLTTRYVKVTSST